MTAFMEGNDMGRERKSPSLAERLRRSPAPANGTQATKEAETKRRAPRVATYQPFPIDALPAPIGAYVLQGTEALGCDHAYVALPCLAAAASAIGNSRVIRLKRGWTEPSI